MRKTLRYNGFMNRLGVHVWARCLWLMLAVSVLLAVSRPPVRGETLDPNYGANVATAAGMVKAAELGLGWVRIYYPEQVVEAERYGLKALLLLGWDSPLSDVQSWGQRVYDTVARYRGRIAAYQICNEPNLAEMWHRPKYADPGEYVAFLREAYQQAKTADPNCLVVSAGLAINGGAGDLAMDDVAFLRGMYAAGAKPYFDVLGAHPYGFGYAPEDATSNPILCFRRVEQYRTVMLQYADGAKPIWATEIGWITEPPSECYGYGDWPTRWWQRVSAQTQADYLVRAFRFARTNWPWMGVMFVWNMDYSLASWNDYCDQKSWFAILNHDGTPRPAYIQLAQMLQGQPAPTVTLTPTARPPVDTGTVVGRVVLEGRSNHAGAQLSIAEQTGNTGEDGSFRIERVPAGTHRLQARMAGYLRYGLSALSVQASSLVTVPDILLRAGDVNDDDQIDLFDLVAVSTRYGTRPPDPAAGDLNGDGEINLFDLVLVGKNYGAHYSEI